MKLRFGKFGALLSLVTASSAFAVPAWGSTCTEDKTRRYDQQIALAQAQLQTATDSAVQESLRGQISSLGIMKTQAINDCASRDADLAQQKLECENKNRDYNNTYKTGAVTIWEWKNDKCVNHSEAKKNAAADDSDCGTASVYTSLNGGNCKKAADTIASVQSRTGALSDATTAATTAFSNMQASGATGAQDDAQTRTANAMKMAAFSKMATSALNLQGAMQLRGAASGASAANSQITTAQQALLSKCQNDDPEMQQACLYQNAGSVGLSQDQANVDNMKLAAQQAQDQANAANDMAKNSMITGASDMLVGLQAMRMAQMAGANAGALAPPVPPPPPPPANLGGGTGSSGAPPVVGGLPPTTAPVDYGVPSGGGPTFGAQAPNHIDSSLMPGNMGTPTTFKAASSTVSGGGGGGGTGGSGALKPSAQPNKNAANRKTNTTAGEYNLAGGGGFKGGGPEKAEAGANPLAEMLAKMFPQDQSGKTVVDPRQIASVGQATGVEPAAQESPVTAVDVSIFEQISAKYRQLNDSGRF